MMSNRRRIIFIILRLICITLFITSYLFDYKYAGKPTFFTVQSNAFALVIMFVFTVYDILILSKKNICIPSFLYKFKYIATVSISLTCIVFCFLLTPLLVIQSRADVSLAFSSISMHLIIPIISIIDYLLDGFDKRMKLYYLPLSLTFPLYYLGFAYVASSLGVKFQDYVEGKEVLSKFPYFFLDYEKYGWLTIDGSKIGVIYWYIMIIIDIMVISLILVLVKNYLIKKTNRVKQ